MKKEHEKSNAHQGEIKIDNKNNEDSNFAYFVQGFMFGKMN